MFFLKVLNLNITSLLDSDWNYQEDFEKSLKKFKKTILTLNLQRISIQFGTE